VPSVVLFAKLDEIGNKRSPEPSRRCFVGMSYLMRLLRVMCSAVLCLLAELSIDEATTEGVPPPFWTVKTYIVEMCRTQLQNGILQGDHIDQGPSWRRSGMGCGECLSVARDAVAAHEDTTRRAPISPGSFFHSGVSSFFASSYL
jgi:hypothetical protein